MVKTSLARDICSLANVYGCTLTPINMLRASTRATVPLAWDVLACDERIERCICNSRGSSPRPFATSSDKMLLPSSPGKVSTCFKLMHVPLTSAGEQQHATIQVAGSHGSCISSSRWRRCRSCSLAAWQQSQVYRSVLFLGVVGDNLR